MIFKLLHPGSAPKGALDQAAGDYRDRVARHHRVEERFVKAAKLPMKGASAADVRRGLTDERGRLERGLGARDVLVVLDRQGEAVGSRKLARRVESWLGGGHTGVAFVLGSAWGVDPELTRRAAWRWSFGPATLPHDLARVVLWEQLYRALAILRGEPYHKELDRLLAGD